MLRLLLQTRLRSSRLPLITCIAVIVLGSCLDLFAQTSVFTYQGRLADGGTPATGTYQMQFSIFDTLSGGTQIGTTITNNSVAVSGGIFTVQLDFSPALPFAAGADRWLEVAVKKPADPTFTPMLPRQRVTSSPYSLRTISASAADSLSANCVGCVTDAHVSNTITVGASGSVSDSALSANVAHLNVAETISGNWINTANPWADNEVADTLSINNGIIDNTAIGFNGPAAGAFTTLTATSLTTTGTTNANVVNAATQYNIGGSAFIRFSGASSTFVGFDSGPSNTGIDNSFFGKSTGFSNTTGSRNSFFGTIAGSLNVGGSDNSFFGSAAGSSNAAGNNNSFFGASAGRNTTGSNNNFFGKSAGQANTTGASNSFFGGGQSNTTGSGNAFFGNGSGFANTTGVKNSFFGFSAGASNTTGGGNLDSTGNSYFGHATGFSSTTTGRNAFFGGQAGYFTTTGDFNTFVGTAAGYDNITGSKNTLIGYQANVLNSAYTYATAIGADSMALGSNRIVLGRQGGQDEVYIPGFLWVSSLGSGTTHICTDTVTFRLANCSSSLRYKTNIASFKPGLILVNQLNPIEFDWKSSGLRDVGFGAEEVAAINPLFVTYNRDGQIEGVKYDVLSVAFVNAFKEQQAQIEAQQKQIDELKLLVCTLKPDAAVCGRKE